MATKTPIDPKDGMHGEEEVKPLFGPGSDDPSKTILDKPTFRGDDPGEEALARREAAGGVSSRGAVGSGESGIADQLGRGFTGDMAKAALPGTALTRAIPQLMALLRRNKKKAAAGGGVAGIIGSLIFVFGVMQGPFEFVHLAQLLQQFHLQSNEDFGNNEGAKTLFYAVTGRGAQRARLGIPGNYAADKWETKLLKETGLKPVYSSKTRLLVGFEIVDEDKMTNKLLDVPENSKTSRALDESMGKGAEIVNAGDVAGQDVVTGTGDKLPNDRRMISLKNVSSFRERGKFIKTVGKLTNTNDIVSTLASRLLKKRAGVDFHPLKKVYRKAGEKLADWRAEQRKESAKEDRQGTKEGGVKAGDTEDTDGDGKPDSASQADTDAADGAGELIKEAGEEPGKATIKSILSKAGYGSAAVGVLCAAKGFGDSIPDYKYSTIVLPMLRMGFKAISIGNQIMTGEDLSTDELGAFAESLFDPDSGTSWADASTIQGEQGQKRTGPGMPAAAKLSGVDDKGFIFNVLDSIKGLGAVCTISDIPSSLPVIGDVINFGSDAVLAGVNAAASVFGTSVDQIMQGALALASGQAVDTLAQGADYGNLVNTGAFLAGIDNAISMGGTVLSAAQVTELKNYENANLADANKSKSFAERYLDPSSAYSLTGKLMDDTPHSIDNVASLFTSSARFFTGGFAKILPFGSNPIVSADANVDYGIPKFGFSLADQEDPEFEDPYDNAVKVEPKLDKLNDKYGKPCFGMTVTTNDDGINIQTEEMGSDDLNVFKVLDKKECTQNSGALSSDSGSNNSFWSKLAFWRTDKAEAASGGGSVDPWFTRYRHYLADAVSVASNACWQADGDPEGEKYCDMLGFSNSSAPTDVDTGTTESPGDTIDLDHLYDSSVSISCAPHTKDLGIQDGYHDNNKIKIRVCAVSNVPSTSSESAGDYGVSGANGKLIVNSRISQVIYDMAEDAKKDGVAVDADSGFRTMAHQECLYAHTCGDNPAATPGTSNHQMGVAVDWQSPMYTWLANGNGSKWGFKALVDGEPWHWSPTGN